MGTVVDFPTRNTRGIAYLETQLQQLLTDKGADAALVAFARRQLTDSYALLNEREQYTFSVHFPESLSDAEQTRLTAEINAGLEGIRSENHALLLELIARLLLTEMRLYQEQRTD